MNAIKKLVQTGPKHLYESMGTLRSTLEIPPEKRPWNKAQAVFLCTRMSPLARRKSNGQSY